jgi:hypothetical protein
MSYDEHIFNLYCKNVDGIFTLKGSRKKIDVGSLEKIDGHYVYSYIVWHNKNVYTSFQILAGNLKDIVNEQI